MNNTLQNLINPNYLNKETIKQASIAFTSNNIIHNIQLQSFLKENIFKSLQKEMKLLSYSHKYKPDIHSYSSADVPESFISLLESEEFKKLIQEITKTKLTNVTAEACYFKHRNYTILNDKETIKDGISFFFDLSSWDNKFGGYTVFVNKDKNLIQQPVQNSLTLALQSKHQRNFIKYTNNHAKDNKRFIIKGYFKEKLNK